jgi:hypothetical protein
MSWLAKKHITKIFNAFKRNKERIYKEDIEALKELDEIVNTDSKRIATDNLIYSKLLCIYLIQNASYHNGAKESIKALQFELKKPLSKQLELLSMVLNDVEQIEFLKSLGFYKDVYSEDEDLVKQHQKEIIEKINKTWDFETVEKSFYNSANDLIKDVNNYT